MWVSFFFELFFGWVWLGFNFGTFWVGMSGFQFLNFFWVGLGGFHFLNILGCVGGFNF